MSCSCSSKTNIALGASFAKLSMPADQLPTKSDVPTDFTILSDLYEHKIVLSDKSFTSMSMQLHLL